MSDNEKKYNIINVSPSIIAAFIKKEIEDKGKDVIYNGKSYRINSIFVEADTGHHLYIFASNGKFIDFKTNTRGDFIWFVKSYLDLKLSREKIRDMLVMKYRTVSSSDIKERINNIRKDDIFNGEEIFPVRIEKPDDFLALSKVTDHNKKFFNYLNGRGIDNRMIKKFKFHYAVSGKYENRVILPIFYEKKFVYFIARDVTGTSKLKYLNPSGEEVNNNGSGSIVFNLDFVKKGDTVVICEGPFNCFHRTEANTVLVAVQGKKLLTNQFKKIERKKPSKYVIAYDNDKYFKDSMMSTFKYLTSIAKVDAKVEIIDWEQYKKIKDDVCDFGDLYGKVDELKIYSTNFQMYVQNHFLGV